MKNNLLKLSMIVLAVSIAGLAYSQNPSTIAIKSHLTNIEEEAVANTKIDVSLSVLNSEGVKCFETEKSLVTKNDGSLALYIQDLPPVFSKGSGSDPVVIQLTITSPDGDSWLEEEKFMVKYLLTISGSAGNTEYALTRMEGQKLNYEYATDIWKFDDIYPFAYIHSSFLFSFNEDITDAESLILAADALFKASEGEKMADPSLKTAPASRGVKGSPAVGGYKKKN